MNVIQTNKTDQTGMHSTTSTSSTPLLNTDGNAGSDERNDDSGNGTNTGIENKTVADLAYVKINYHSSF